MGNGLMIFRVKQDAEREAQRLNAENEEMRFTVELVEPYHALWCVKGFDGAHNVFLYEDGKVEVGIS